MHSPPPEVPPDAAPDLLLSDRKRKQKERSKEESRQMDNNAFYGIVSSPIKDSPRLTLKLTRVKSPDVEPTHISSHESDLVNINDQLSRTARDKPGAEEQADSQHAPVQHNTKEPGVIGVYDDAEIDTLVEMERIDRETANEKERCSKEVQDKGIVSYPSFLTILLVPD